MGSGNNLRCSELSSDWQSLLDLTFPEPFVNQSHHQAHGFVENSRNVSCGYVPFQHPSNQVLHQKNGMEKSCLKRTEGESFYEAKTEPQLKTIVDRNSEEYRKRRERNNIAVRRSREKAKQKIQAKEDELKMLTISNSCLKRRCEVLEEEVKILRSVHETFNQRLDPIWIEAERRLRSLREQKAMLLLEDPCSTQRGHITPKEKLS